MNASTATRPSRSSTLTSLGEGTCILTVNGAEVEVSSFQVCDTRTVNIVSDAGIITLLNATGACTVDTMIGIAVDTYGADVSAWNEAL